MATDFTRIIASGALCVCSTALFLLFYAIRPAERDAGKERRLAPLKKIRLGTFALLVCTQVAHASWRFIRGRFMLAAYDAQLAATTMLYAITVVGSETESFTSGAQCVPDARLAWLTPWDA